MRPNYRHSFPDYSNLIFDRLHPCSSPIWFHWAEHAREPRNLARVIRAENHNSGNRMSAADIGEGFNVAGVEHHGAFRYRGKPLLDRQVRLVRNMRAKLRRR